MRNMAASFEEDVKTAVTATDEDPELQPQQATECHIAPKYQGTDEDKLHMRTLGRGQETRRMFTFVTLLGKYCSTTHIWDA